MADEISPVGVDLDKLLTSMTDSLINASEHVHERTTTSGHGYVIPEMSVTVQMSFSYESGKVKGWLRKSTQTSTQQVESSVSFKVVAIPELTGQMSSRAQDHQRADTEHWSTRKS
ncbi:MAG: hypothetical protein QNJ12_16175 [Ilumatobacter sp.]|uniref:hypothetical protein n=1 Tax=Ilumatobacter sp. TaxID=1967498 RepID=UPI00261A27B8|nr:hypothetical protein [Ilumatobacter sp.]MDJ0770336.1 hypothetical protein [Ilumatobacter sp.]